MRIYLNLLQRGVYFQKVKKVAGLSWSKIAEALNVNDRMLRCWRSGEFTLPANISNKIEKRFGIRLPHNHKLLNLYWHTKWAGKKGAFKRYALYGNPGTLEGRRKGGLNSLKSRSLKNTSFKFLKQIRIPKHSLELAELIGIMIGDGGITNFQVRVTLNKEDDKEYVIHTSSLFKKLFHTTPTVFHRKSTSEIVVSRKALVDYLVSKGLPRGNKIAQEIDIPEWIKADKNLSCACLRGIFDTDGSVYFDKHLKGNYSSMNLAITSASGKLLFSIYEILAKQMFTPTISSRRSIRIRKSEQVRMFFDKIHSHNPKHLKKFLNFLNMERYPSGYTGTVSKTVGV